MSTIVRRRSTGWMISCRMPAPRLLWLPALETPTRCSIRCFTALPFLLAIKRRTYKPEHRMSHVMLSVPESEQRKRDAQTQRVDKSDFTLAHASLQSLEGKCQESNRGVCSSIKCSFAGFSALNAFILKVNFCPSTEQRSSVCCF